MLRGLCWLALLGGAISAAGAAAGAAPLPPLGQRCGSQYADVQAQIFRFKAADGTSLDGALLGNGSVGVVLATEYPADLCGWLEYGLVLQHEGFSVLLFDFRGFGLSARGARNDYAGDVVGAARELRRRGAHAVALVGASLGGAAVMVAGARMSGITAVVSLSGETDLPGTGLHALRAVPRLRAPLLIMNSRLDNYSNAADGRKLYRAAGSKVKRLALYPGGYHGWDLVDVAPFKAKASATLIGFLRAHARV